MKKLLITALLAICFFSVSAQENEKKSKKELKTEKKARQNEQIKTIIESKNFVFNARSANPMNGRSVTLSSEYDVKITNDSIFSYLPYYGIAYSASYGGTDSPMIFDLPFETCTLEKVKNGYMVKVGAKNKSDRLTFTFYVSETGTINLNVSSINRQAISYYGEIENDK